MQNHLKNRMNEGDGEKVYSSASGEPDMNQT